MLNEVIHIPIIRAKNNNVDVMLRIFTYIILELE
jgi:hypothetical protein